MTNAERIMALRNCSDGLCSLCPYDDHKLSTKGCEAKLMRDAADALEAAERLLDQNVKRCEALRKQLRESHKSYEQRISELEEEHNKTVTAIFGEEQLWWENRCKELEAQLPKEGVWIDAFVGELPVQVCSKCNTFFPLAYTGGGHHYCPNCGSVMKGEQENE